jgi:hypothetical protein
MWRDDAIGIEKKEKKNDANETSAEYPVVAPNCGSCCSVVKRCVKHSFWGALRRLWHQRHSRRMAGSEAEVRYKDWSIAG